MYPANLNLPGRPFPASRDKLDFVHGFKLQLRNHCPMISENDTNIAYLCCRIHTNYLGYVCGYVFDGWRMRTKSFW